MIYLKMKCPHCYASLMDNNKFLDNKPSLRLKIRYKGKEGFIWLSGIYGSHEHKEDFEILEGETADFFCPSCSESLVGDTKCEECNADMVSLRLEEGGRIRFCSRSGCINHSLEFKRPEIALKLLYDTYTYDNHNPEVLIEKIKNSIARDEKERREIIKNGTFLYTYCPHCQKSLIKDNEIEMNIINKEGEKGSLHLSPYLNIFKHRTTIRLKIGEDIRDISCPYCKHTLIVEKNCPECGSDIARILVTSAVKLVEFYFCTKPGCRWHGISVEDEEVIMLEESREW